MKIAHLHVSDQLNKGDVAIVQAVQQLLEKRFRGSVEFTDISLSELSQPTPGTLEAINNSNLAVIGGGGIYYHYFLPFNLDLINRIKPPIVTYGVGYIQEFGGNPLNKTEITSIACLNQRAALKSVRDIYTREFLEKIGINDVALIGDPACLLEEKPERIINGSKLKIGFNLNYSGWLGFGKFKDQIMTSYRETMEQLRKNHGAQIYYLLQHPSERNIVQELQVPDLEIIDLSPAGQKHFYGQLDLVIGMMLHSVVMAFGAGTPEINIAYDQRNLSFARFLDCPELCLLPQDLQPGTLVQKVTEVLDQKQFYRKKFRVKKEEIQKSQQTFLAKIKDLTA
ncbi:polysaccharide pyruvyl transferase family protein [Patescibacteria group bacterium]|nr:polysaccharide pyruvyl transferase family protein [Patescibacteria group bacterium]